MTGLDTAAIIALAASAAGTGLGVDASMREQRAEEQKAKDEVARQRGYQKRASGEFANSVAQADAATARKQIATGTAQREAESQQVGAIPLTSASALPAATGTQAAGLKDQIIQSQAARAKMGGYSDYDLQQWIKNLRTQQQLGLIGGEAQASQQVLPYELQAAGRSAEGERAVGQGVSALGMLAGLGGAAGLFGNTAAAGSSVETPVTNAAFFNTPEWNAALATPKGLPEGWSF